MDLSYHPVYTMNKIQARRYLVQTYLQTGSLARTAQLWQTSRQVVRKWVRRFQTEGAAGLEDRSRRPHSCPRRTSAEVEERVVHLRHQTGYGRRRLSRLLWHREGLALSPNTIRHILNRHGLVLFWLGAHGITQRVQWQTDWGSEWGGESLQQIERLNERFFRPVGTELVRFPLGRKGYNGRVEVLRTALRTDDEEFYLPLLDRISTDWVLGPGNDLLTHYTLI